MSFNSLAFLAFFAVFYSLYLVVRERTWMRLAMSRCGSRSPWRKVCVTVSLLCGIGSLNDLAVLTVGREL